MKNYKLIYAALIAALFLSGCNDGGSEVSVDDNDTNFVADTPVTVYAKDDFEFVQTEPSSQYYINLEDSVDLSGSADIKLDKLSLISGDSACQLISQDKHGFTVSTNSTTVCDYQYSVTSTDSSKLDGKTQALSRVVISEDPEQSELVPFGMTAYQDQTTTIDIATELKKVGDMTDLDGYTLSENVVITSDSSGSSAIADPTTNSIEYKPGDGFTGIEEILYSLTNGDGLVLAGSAIITVAPESTQGIQIEKKIVIDEGVQVNELATIDLSEYVTADPADDWQLVYVSNFGAQVELKDKNDLQNKAFTFLADRAGDYYVNAVVTDHHGGFDTSLIQILVADPAGTRNWSYIVNGLNVFSAPLTKTDADSEAVNYDGANYDSGVGLSVASFNYTSAKAYCNSFGQLPTQEELTNMKNAQNPEVQGWPMGLAYWTSAPNTLINLKNGNVTAPDGTKPYYVTCINTGEFAINTAESMTHAVANGIDAVKVVAYLTFDGQPVPNQSVDASLSDGAQASFQSPQISDENGRVEFDLTDYKAEPLTVYLTYRGVTHSIDVEFIADKSTASISAETIIDNALAESGQDLVKATLLDENNNPIKGETVKFSSDDAQNIKLSSQGAMTNENGEQLVNVAWIGEMLPQMSASITATYTLPDSHTISDTTIANFEQPAVNVTSIKLSPTESPTIELREYVKFSVTAYYSDGTHKDVSKTATWSSSNSNVLLDVDSSGTFLGIASGFSIVSASYTEGDFDSTVSNGVTVVEPQPTYTLTITPSVASLFVGDTTQLTLTATPVGGSASDVTNSAQWSSSNNNVAVVSSQGLVTAIGTGQAVVTANYQGQSAISNIAVTQPDDADYDGAIASHDSDPIYPNSRNAINLYGGNEGWYRKLKSYNSGTVQGTYKVQSSSGLNKYIRYDEGKYDEVQCPSGQYYNAVYGVCDGSTKDQALYHYLYVLPQEMKEYIQENAY